MNTKTNNLALDRDAALKRYESQKSRDWEKKTTPNRKQPGSPVSSGPAEAIYNRLALFLRKRIEIFLRRLPPSPLHGATLHRAWRSLVVVADELSVSRQSMGGNKHRTSIDRSQPTVSEPQEGQEPHDRLWSRAPLPKPSRKPCSELNLAAPARVNDPSWDKKGCYFEERDAYFGHPAVIAVLHRPWQHITKFPGSDRLGPGLHVFVDHDAAGVHFKIDLASQCRTRSSACFLTSSGSFKDVLKMAHSSGRVNAQLPRETRQQLAQHSSATDLISKHQCVDPEAYCM
ncbi:uncharacterized protein CLUP02_05214 [Colletotrichum lupini]|uniref:Uncharacterized protein n=1 Tax=Colletotrichum lupini TaxID=145971 RepID=A0A9Q8WDV1_9PEZI|nr:uncharacterized protein CLUP02_05214 [Colletotrichum lupini]UQC79734.1 hypothetical protein CLUP02_05214 [Colletotrichum lupini]